MACDLCWHPDAPEKHHDGCPHSGGSRKVYDYAWSLAFNGYEYIEPIALACYYHPTFVLGYREGKRAINKIIDGLSHDDWYDEDEDLR